MQREVQFLQKSWKNVIVCCVDRLYICTCIVLFCIIVPLVNTRE